MCRAIASLPHTGLYRAPLKIDCVCCACLSQNFLTVILKSLRKMSSLMKRRRLIRHKRWHSFRWQTNKKLPSLRFYKNHIALSGRHTRQRVIHNSYMNFTVVCCFLGGQREGTAENGSCLRNEKLKQNNKKNKHNRDAENGSMEIVLFFRNNETLILARQCFLCAALLEKRKRTNKSSKSRVKREGGERNLLIGFYDG